MPVVVLGGRQLLLPAGAAPAAGVGFCQSPQTTAGCAADAGTLCVGCGMGVPVVGAHVAVCVCACCIHDQHQGCHDRLQQHKLHGALLAPSQEETVHLQARPSGQCITRCFVALLCSMLQSDTAIVQCTPCCHFCCRQVSACAGMLLCLLQCSPAWPAGSR